VNLEDISVFLIPLERVNSAGNTWVEAILDVVVNAQVCLDQVGEVFNNLALVFVEKSLQFGDVLELVEILFEFCI
jgi:hypothetical protein